MESIATRIQDALHASGLTVRNLAAIANVHYTTIYLILRKDRKGQTVSPLKVVEESLDRSVNEINALVADKKLPLPKDLPQGVKRDKLTQLISELSK